MAVAPSWTSEHRRSAKVLSEESIMLRSSTNTTSCSGHKWHLPGRQSSSRNARRSRTRSLRQGSDANAHRTAQSMVPDSSDEAAATALSSTIRSLYGVPPHALQCSSICNSSCRRHRRGPPLLILLLLVHVCTRPMRHQQGGIYGQPSHLVQEATWSIQEFALT